MELASMLAGDRFGDRPASVCPVIGSILRVYNDVIDDSRRHDLYRYAAEAVGTRGGFDLQHRRAAVAVAWARAGYRPLSRWRRLMPTPPIEPGVDSGPDGIAEYVVGSLHRSHGASAHIATLWLLDRLIAMSSTNVITSPQLKITAAAAPMPTCQVAATSRSDQPNDSCAARQGEAGCRAGGWREAAAPLACPQGASAAVAAVCA
jgi:hypothetical protein